jgi:hypothetical protein
LDHSFIIATLSCSPWLPSEFESHVIAICADEGYIWETLSLLRGSIDWARQRKCTHWMMTGDTAYDLEPIVKRLGIKDRSPRYILDLRG